MSSAEAQSRRISVAFVVAQAMLFLAYFVVPELYAFRFPAAIRWTGLLLAGLGIGIGVWAGLRLGRHLSPFPIPTPQAQLITDGLFRYVRHPIYTGLLLFFTGIALWDESLTKLLFIPVFAGFFYAKSMFEETQLAKRFETYEAYRKKTGRFWPNV